MNFEISAKTELYPHQSEAVEKLLPLRVGALFMEHGTGRTRTAIELVRRRTGKFSAVIWFCPYAIKENIRAEILKHCGAIAPCWNIIGIESMSSNLAAITEALDRIDDRAFVILDQSHYIKGYRAKRSNRIVRAAARARYRLIMSGLPISQGVQDLFMQFTFLSSKILGYRSFYSFSANHLEYDRYHPQKVIRAHNLEYLSAKIAPYVYQTTREACGELPERLYSVRRFRMNPLQRELYRRLKERVLQAGVFNSHSLFTLFTRLQQVLSGFCPDRHGRLRPLGNPRLEALEELLLSLGSRVRIVIWAKFQFDLDTLESQLPPEETVVLRAGIPPEEQEKILSAFRSERRILVASVKLSRCPLDLNAADVVIFYNNTFSYAERVRAEERCQTPGRRRTIRCIDLLCADSIDEKIRQSLLRKNGVAVEFRTHIEKTTGFSPENWIQSL